MDHSVSSGLDRTNSEQRGIGHSALQLGKVLSPLPSDITGLDLVVHPSRIVRLHDLD